MQVLEKNLSGGMVATESETKKVIHSRFGNIAVDLQKAIYFPAGLLGMPDKQHFCLADIPEKPGSAFKVLQSLNDIELAFMVIPLPETNALIEPDDLQNIYKILDTTADNIAVILIASVHDTPEGKRASVNVRAPLVINLLEKAGAQYVFPSNKYKIRHMLPGKGE